MPLKPEIAGGGLNEYQIIKHGRQQSWRRLIQTLWSLGKGVYVLRALINISAAIIVGLFLSGCVTTKEGFSLGKGPQFGAEAIIKHRQLRLEDKGSEVANSQSSSSNETEVNLILIGTVSALRRFDESNIEKFYTSYAKFSNQVHPESEATLSYEQFKIFIAGWTRLKHFTVPLTYGSYEDALVPLSLIDQIRFPSTVGTYMFQVSGDLLAAQANDDGFYIINEILCNVGPGYVECAKDYDKGVFDAISGIELDKKLQPKKSGKKIDVESYKLIDSQL